ncbi:MAG: hypothetical protein ACREEM_16680 [Blastocatellia bacterium]
MSSILNTDAALIDARPRHLRLGWNLKQGREIVAEFSGEKPLWLDHVTAHINKLLDLQPGWDSYQARAVDVASVKTCLDILSRTMQPETPLPQVVPTSRGTIHLEWHLRGIDLEVEALPSGALKISYENVKTGEIIEDLTTSGITEIERALKELSMRG